MVHQKGLGHVTGAYKEMLGECLPRVWHLSAGRGGGSRWGGGGGGCSCCFVVVVVVLLLLLLYVVVKYMSEGNGDKLEVVWGSVCLCLFVLPLEGGAVD